MDADLTTKTEQLAAEFAARASSIEEVNGLMRGLMKATLERMLNTELDAHLGRSSGTAEPDVSSAGPGTVRNRRNGHSRKTVQGESGALPLKVPRDREGTFEPLLIPKYERRIPDFDSKIVALHAKGMTTRDIQDIVRQLYGVEISPALVSAITSDLDEQVQAWQSRPLTPVWPIVYLDGIVVHVRGESGHVGEHTAYVAIGVNLEGKKELLGLWLAETEGAKFWLSCLTDLKSRGLDDIFVVCIDGLSGFSEAIRAAYPQAKVQLCLVHLVRAALRYVPHKDSQAVVADLKKIYQAPIVAEAAAQLDAFETKWQRQYPTIVRQWRGRWPEIVPMFEFPPEIRKAIYTTNAIESVNSSIRKYTRNRKLYPSREAALKSISLAIQEASRKWTMPIKGWKAALNHFAILFDDRLPQPTR